MDVLFNLFYLHLNTFTAFKRHFCFLMKVLFAFMRCFILAVIKLLCIHSQMFIKDAVLVSLL